MKTDEKAAMAEIKYFILGAVKLPFILFIEILIIALVSLSLIPKALKEIGKNIK